MLFQTYWLPTNAGYYSRMLKSKMADEIQDDGRKIWIPSSSIF